MSERLLQVRRKFDLWIRLSHWLNVPVLAMMIWSGILIYWASDIYPGFFPRWFINGLPSITNWHWAWESILRLLGSLF